MRLRAQSATLAVPRVDRKLSSMTSRERTERAVARSQPWPDRLARAGFIAKGAVYLLVGGLAVAAAAGLGARPTDPGGALAAVARAPLGRLALAAIALGLLAHAAFRLVLAVVGDPGARQDPRALRWRRAACAGSAVVYTGLAVTAGMLALGAWRRPPDHDRAARRGAAALLLVPFGRALLALLALAVLGGAAYWLARAFGHNDVRRWLRVDRMTPRQCRTMEVLGRIAFAARGLVLAVVGSDLWRAAAHDRPRDARGPAGALQQFEQQPHGALLLGFVGAGLMVFGAYALLESRWRRLFA